MRRKVPHMPAFELSCYPLYFLFKCVREYVNSWLHTRHQFDFLCANFEAAWNAFQAASVLELLYCPDDKRIKIRPFSLAHSLKNSRNFLVSIFSLSILRRFGSYF